MERFKIEFQWIDLPVTVSHRNSRGTGSVSLRVRFVRVSIKMLLTYLLTYLSLLPTGGSTATTIRSF